MDASGSPILDEIRRRCATVAASATLVTIDPDAVRREAARLAAELDAADVEAPAGDPWVVAGDDHAEQRAGVVLALATINFGSGYHPVVRKDPGRSGATTMAARLRAWIEAEGGVRPRRLASLSVEDAHRIFDQPVDDGPVSELMGLFAAALDDLGNLVVTVYGGSFVALIDAASASAGRLVELLAELPFYADRATYRGAPVPFYKRGQLAAADLHRAFGGTGPGRFDDLDRLTAFADNLVPHVLRLDGVLRYDPDLAATIDAGTLLPAGSEAEVEIRAAGVHAVELLRAELAAGGRQVRSSDLDLLLWRRGGGAAYKAVPRHRTRSTAY